MLRNKKNMVITLSWASVRMCDYAQFLQCNPNLILGKKRITYFDSKFNSEKVVRNHFCHIITILAGKYETLINRTILSQFLPISDSFSMYSSVS